MPPTSPNPRPAPRPAATPTPALPASSPTPSTVTRTARYARAAVDNTRTGVGGEMLLARRDGRWRRLFLGTNDFCTAPLPRAALADLGFRCPVS